MEGGNARSSLCLAHHVCFGVWAVRLSTLTQGTKSTVPPSCGQRLLSFQVGGDFWVARYSTAEVRHGQVDISRRRGETSTPRLHVPCWVFVASEHRSERWRTKKATSWRRKHVIQQCTLHRSHRPKRHPRTVVRTPARLERGRVRAIKNHAKSLGHYPSTHLIRAKPLLPAGKSIVCHPPLPLTRS